MYTKLLVQSDWLLRTTATGLYGVIIDRERESKPPGQINIIDVVCADRNNGIYELYFSLSVFIYVILKFISNI